MQSTKIATRPNVASFLLVDSGETSSNGPGCLYKDMKRTKIPIG